MGGLDTEKAHSFSGVERTDGIGTLRLTLNFICAPSWSQLLEVVGKTLWAAVLGKRRIQKPPIMALQGLLVRRLIALRAGSIRDRIESTIR